MSERTIDQVLTEIAGLERTANTELDAINPAVRPGFEMAIREAKEGLVRLREEYRARVFSQAVAFFMTGDREKVTRFSALAQQLGNVFVVDGTGLYEKLADQIEPTIGRSREFSINQLSRLVLVVREIARAAGLKGDLPSPTIKELRVVPDRAAVVAYVRELVTEALGESLNAIFVGQDLLNQALARKFTGNVLAAVVLNAPPGSQPALAQPFATKTEVAIGVEDEVDEAFVLRVFESNSKKNKTKKTK